MEIDDLGHPQPCLPGNVTGTGGREKKEGALRGGQSHGEGIEPGVRGGGGYSILSRLKNYL
jgi:hypothetical protein